MYNGLRGFGQSQHWKRGQDCPELIGVENFKDIPPDGLN